MTWEAATIRVSHSSAAVAEYPSGATFGPRTLRDYELVWLLHGTSTWESGETRLELPPGHLLLLRPGMRDRFTWDTERPTRHAYAHFRIESGAGGLGPSEWWPLTRPLVPAGPLDSLCAYLLWLAVSGDDHARERGDEVLALLLTLFIHGPLPAGHVDEPLPDPVRRAVGQVRRTWREYGMRAVALAELAEAAAVSPGHISRLFRARLGCGAVAAFERVRLARASTMLARTNLSVEAISRSCGFANPYHFSRRFRAVHGLPPRDYRRASPELRHVALGTPGLLAIARHLSEEQETPVGVS